MKKKKGKTIYKTEMSTVDLLVHTEQIPTILKEQLLIEGNVSK